MLEIQCFTEMNGNFKRYGSAFAIDLPAPDDYAKTMLDHGYDTAERCEGLEQELGEGSLYELWRFEMKPTPGDGRGVRISYRGIRKLGRRDGVDEAERPVDQPLHSLPSLPSGAAA